MSTTTNALSVICCGNLEFLNFLDESVDDLHFKVVQVIRDVYLIIMRIDQSSFARTETAECLIVVSLLLDQGVHRSTSSAVFDHFMLQWKCSIFARLECLIFVTVVFLFILRPG